MANPQAPTDSPIALLSATASSDGVARGESLYGCSFRTH
jgi:hypothetical protein